MLEAALSYAAKGWAVFPCKDKRPMVRNGFYAGTTDEAQIRAWWKEWPDAQIAVRTGSGFWVFDVDAPDGIASLVELEKANGALPRTREQRTGGGGRHLFFKMPSEHIIRNSASQVAPGIDVRGEGGYAIVPPSSHESGKNYEWANDEPIADAPLWLVQAAMSKKAPKEGLCATVSMAEVQEGLCGLVSMVEKAQEGTRNDTLNKAAFRAGSLIANGDMEREEAEQALYDVAVAAGLPPEEVEKTIASGLRAGHAAAATAMTTSGSLRVVTHRELAAMDVPKPVLLLDPILSERGLTMLFAARGIGKTWVALCIAVALACGRMALGRWSAPEPRKVLYVDGEMSLNMLKERLSALYPDGNPELVPDGNLRIVSPELQGGPMPNLATREGQLALAPHIEGVDLVIVDNLATLAINGSENDADAWRPVQAWLLELRRMGKAVLLVHHAGKSGGQRGSSAKEDILDVVINLKRPDDYKADEGARFVVDFTKARGIYGDDAKAFEAALVAGEQGATWAISFPDDGDEAVQKVIALHEAGKSFREIETETGVSKSRAERICKKR
ncbi:MAG: bifunctional DNA primase/polymerase [Proteobacteria bacterium]|nr:bifunctional DNA primase/polymerase [Pseudomonadota bacterium]